MLKLLENYEKTLNVLLNQLLKFKLGSSYSHLCISAFCPKIVDKVWDPKIVICRSVNVPLDTD